MTVNGRKPEPGPESAEIAWYVRRMMTYIIGLAVCSAGNSLLIIIIGITVWR